MGPKLDMAAFKVGHYHFASLASNIVQVYTCKQVKLHLQASDTCHCDIKVEHERWRFLDIQTRLAKEMLAEVPCRLYMAPPPTSPWPTL